MCWVLSLGTGCSASTGQASPKAAIRQVILAAADHDLESIQQVSPDGKAAHETFDFLVSALNQPQGTSVNDEDIEQVNATNFRVLVRLDESPDAELFAEVARDSQGGWVVVRMWRGDD